VGDDADVRGPADRGRGRAGMGERARAEGNAAPTCGPERSVRERRKGAGAEGNWAGTRPTREEKEKGNWAGPRVWGWAAGCFLSFLFLFYTLPIQTKPFEFKYHLNSNLHTQHN
jgi:hypothetical protein